MLNFSVVGIRWRRFLDNMFPLSFKLSYDHGQLFWLATIPLLLESFCSPVRIRTVVPEAVSGSLHLKFWVIVCFLVVALWKNGISEGKVVLNLWTNNFSAGEVLFWSGCEFKDSIGRKWSSELSLALMRVRLTVWIVVI